MTRIVAVPALLAVALILGAASPAALLSHRAEYEVTLAPGSSFTAQIAGVRGRMVVEVRQSCDGFSETQRLIADMTNVDENTERTDYSARTFESADGSKFDFTITDTTMGRGTERYAGHAQGASNGEGRVVFTVPQGGTLALPKGTLFPAEFTAHLIAAARGGAATFSAPVFQGDDAKHVYLASAFIGGEESRPDPETEDAAGMRGVRSWPMIVSYYPADSQDAAPEYELAFRGYENGVATALRMRYPSFALEGRLIHLDVLDATCNPAASAAEGKHE